MASANDMKSAESTYSGFISALKISIPLLTVIVIAVIAMIV